MEKGVQEEKIACAKIMCSAWLVRKGVWKGPWASVEISRGRRGQDGKGLAGQPKEFGLDPVGDGGHCEVSLLVSLGRGLKEAARIQPVTGPRLLSGLSPRPPRAPRSSGTSRREGV